MVMVTLMEWRGIGRRKNQWRMRRKERECDVLQVTLAAAGA